MSKETKIELTKATLSSADALLKWPFILNGASAAGLLTFLGNTVDKQAKFGDWTAFGNALLAFAIGLIFALLAAAGKMLTLSYASQINHPDHTATQDELRIYLVVGDRAAISGLACAVLFAASVICFVVGVFIGRHAVFG